MEARAILRFIRVAPRKARLVVDLIRGKMVNEALAILDFSPKYVSPLLKKVLNSAVSNAMKIAENKNSKIDLDKLFIKSVNVDEGPMLKRYMPRAMGRATLIRKRTSHIKIVLGEVSRSS
ncbi:MAG: 50S ribosomal protein L22 [Candidatus Schekmanbacteria bacterium RIFCSPHIGHO2_02_FULL_38_11]|uniref:Large ribosomal subunit protein uL22 n=1 Tax=Candidatus Schekmanbacteria bacterium RIFCSPLOWO2_12_FULL_38_15 TaxID=1817883 RepID=A0A1F7SN94_9BACT|nr:MAG: 50S ribosomal protein L22 [Candidatus Schekmanbacteria bacterium GWA2_38_9]OGL50130.1 MAG: 50S ribosomal protein L22 [Candidatus Schekmanbacteria bacterium RIFCSPLOWO2_02_FULL_38_14]OGL50534.1 MAG: 50S ribosomal protein L22 [Candidatus Schekmanbacteria bacterium RIFCSPHIGHO2_02_FULL_38_11]OGL54698.1 MAG: 50S ribosomal protein L22 [Candidatus Schekmanbacteria bacterium RIFCSPLOWO2_12_FULL_38_15]